MRKNKHYFYDRPFKKHHRTYPYIIVAAMVLTSSTFGLIAFNRNPQQPTMQQAALAEAAPQAAVIPKLDIDWPKYGQAAYGVEGVGAVASSSEKPVQVPIASLAKVITALAVIQKNPMSDNKGGTITLSEEDVALYQKYVSQSGSVVPVEVGETITQYQAMQAMLMPSANNIADNLAVWSFGSLEAYTTYANKMVKDLGLKNTVIADDASGFSPNTISTAEDMTQLGILYMQNPVLRSIAEQKQATIPFAGTITNYNATENNKDKIGIKIGYTDQAGRCFMNASVLNNDGKQTISVAVVLGADNVQKAIKDSAPILDTGNLSYNKALKQTP